LPNKLVINEHDNEFVNSVLISHSSHTQHSNNNNNTNKPSKPKRTSSTESQHIDDTTTSTATTQPTTNNNNQNLNQPFQYLASNLEPKFLLTIIQERLESHRKEFGNRVKCVPSVRTINCQHHCVALLTSRLFTILCNDGIFQQKIINDNQQNSVCFNIIIELLNPNNDPVSAGCLIFYLVFIYFFISLAYIVYYSTRFGFTSFTS
jgi:hypothetical protein